MVRGDTNHGYKIKNDNGSCPLINGSCPHEPYKIKKPAKIGVEHGLVILNRKQSKTKTKL
jgi:hypothetical protein